jgi:hypothetical protein
MRPGFWLRETGASLISALGLLREPVAAEKKEILKRRWEALASELRSPTQGLGRQATGCGATVGVHPRCDFDCSSCYLDENANLAKPLSLDKILLQLDNLRNHLGPKGNVQITDGEITLLPRQILIAILRHSRKIGLIPMLMTHGDSFRRDASLLPALVQDGGLMEIAIHVDSTQRGRRGYKEVSGEMALNPVREEFARMIRNVRRKTGKRLRAAMTLTVTRSNLEQIPGVVDWCLRNRDVFGLVSFQPRAQVGRTRDNGSGVGASALWSRIEMALAPYGAGSLGSPGSKWESPLQFGHPACTRMQTMLVVEKIPMKGAGALKNQDVEFGDEWSDEARNRFSKAGIRMETDTAKVMPLFREGNSHDREIIKEFFERGLGGLNFRDDSPLERVCRTLGGILLDPVWLAGSGLSWVTRRLKEAGTGPFRLAANLLLSRARIGAFTLTSHHFMSRDELETPLGRERLNACAFKVPVGSGMMPMCEMNASGTRAAIYAGSSHPVEAGGRRGLPLAV